MKSAIFIKKLDIVQLIMMIVAILICQISQPLLSSLEPLFYIKSRRQHEWVSDALCVFNNNVYLFPSTGSPQATNAKFLFNEHSIQVEHNIAHRLRVLLWMYCFACNHLTTLNVLLSIQLNTRRTLLILLFFSFLFFKKKVFTSKKNRILIVNR